MLLSEVWSAYHADKQLAGYSKATLKAYHLQARLLIKGIGDVDIDSVTLAQVKGYLAKLTHLKPSSLGNRIRFLRAFFRWAHEEGIIPRNTLSRLKEPKTGKRVPKALSEEELEFLREGCQTVLEHVLFELMFSTGCRVGEIHRLNRNCIDWEHRSIVVHGKGDKEREVYFSVKCAIWLKRYLKTRKDQDMALIVTERAPHRMGIPALRYVIKRIAKQALMQANVYPHKLRHSFATHMLENGAPLEVIQSLLGHEKLETTRLYCELSGPRRREQYRRYF